MTERAEILCFQHAAESNAGSIWKGALKGLAGEAAAAVEVCGVGVGFGGEDGETTVCMENQSASDAMTAQVISHGDAEDFSGTDDQDARQPVAVERAEAAGFRIGQVFADADGVFFR